MNNWERTEIELRLDELRERQSRFEDASVKLDEALAVCQASDVKLVEETRVVLLEIGARLDSIEEEISKLRHFLGEGDDE